jgi:hypothetical protein
LWFSYETPIAVYVPGEGTFIRQNEWSTTTGRHLNEIDSDKSKRITGDEFKGVLARLGLWRIVSDISV